MSELPDQAFQALDIYDREIARLTQEPELIRESWNTAEPLFRYIFNTSRRFSVDPNNAVPQLLNCGCLTMYRTGFYRPEQLPTKLQPVAREIASDERIPRSEFDIQPHHLPVFAEWQRRLDREFPELR